MSDQNNQNHMKYKHLEKQCPVCGQRFQTHIRTQKYCSRTCYYQDRFGERKKAVTAAVLDLDAPRQTKEVQTVRPRGEMEYRISMITVNRLFRADLINAAECEEAKKKLLDFWNPQASLLIENPK